MVKTRSVLQKVLTISEFNCTTISPMNNDQRRLGCVLLPLHLQDKKGEPLPFELSLPPMAHLLGVVVKGDIVQLHFWFWEKKCRVIRNVNTVSFVPSEKMTMLIWEPPNRYSGPIGTYIDSFVIKGGIAHLFDITRYNHETGEVIGSYK